MGEMEKRESLFQFFRESETPGRHSPAYCYAKVSYTAFGEITALRDEGFSMAAICRGLEKKGLLPEDASPSSFRRAFRRELARRERVAKRAKDESLGATVPAKPTPKPAAPNEGKSPNGGRPRQAAGSGSIRKLPNGEFEF